MAVASPLILIVDHFEDALAMYSEYLTLHGYRVAVARTGQEAVAVARAEHPSLIFMELRMPGLTSGETLSLLRQEAPVRDVPIVALTASVIRPERAAVLRDGFDGVLLKPCAPDDLMVAASRLLQDGPRHHAVS